MNNPTVKGEDLKCGIRSYVDSTDHHDNTDPDVVIINAIHWQLFLE